MYYKILSYNTKNFIILNNTHLISACHKILLMYYFTNITIANDYINAFIWIQQKYEGIYMPEAQTHILSHQL